MHWKSYMSKHHSLEQPRHIFQARFRIDSQAACMLEVTTKWGLIHLAEDDVIMIYVQAELL